MTSLKLVLSVLTVTVAAMSPSILGSQQVGGPPLSPDEARALNDITRDTRGKIFEYQRTKYPYEAWSTQQYIRGTLPQPPPPDVGEGYMAPAEPEYLLQRWNSGHMVPEQSVATPSLHLTAGGDRLEADFLEDPEIKEEIIRNVRYPISAVCNGQVWTDKLSGVWSDKLSLVQDNFVRLSRAVGFIRSFGRGNTEAINPLLIRKEIGTAVAVAPNMILTNEHIVTKALGQYDGSQWALRKGQTTRYVVTFLNEASMCPALFGENHFEVKRVVAVGRGKSYYEDYALLEVTGTGGSLIPSWVTFSETRDLRPVERVAVIGYPARPTVGEYEVAMGVDDLPPEFDALIDRLYSTPDGSDVPQFGIQRVSFGEVQSEYSNGYVLGHTSSTVGGNSGSLVVRLADGTAIGLHFGGRGNTVDPQGINLALRGEVIVELLRKISLTSG